MAFFCAYMNKKALLIGSLVAGALWYFGTQGKKLVDNLSFTFGRFRFDFTDLLATPPHVNVFFALGIYNASRLSVRIEGITGSLFIVQNGKKTALSLFRQNTPSTYLAAQSTTEINIKAIIPVTKLAQEIVDIIKDTNFKGSLQVEGSVTAQGITIPFNETIFSA